MRSIRIIIPNGQTDVILDNVPEDATCESIKCRLRGIYDLEEFDLMVQNKVLISTDKIVYNEVKIIPHGATRTNPYLAIAFVLVHIIPMCYLLRGKCIRKCWYCYSMNMMALHVAKIIMSRQFRNWIETKFISSNNILKDLGALYVKSLIPSFRIEHLLIDNPQN